MKNVILAQKVYRIGIQNLVWNKEEDRFFIQIRNRTYSSEVEVTKEKAKVWFNKLREKDLKFVMKGE